MKKSTTDNNKRKALDALRESRGIIAPAFRAVGLNRKTFYDWYDGDPEFKAEYEQILEEQKDFVESKLVNRINNDDTTAIIFYAKTRMRDRGYQENQSVTVNDSNSNVIGGFDPVEALRKLYGKEPAK